MSKEHSPEAANPRGRGTLGKLFAALLVAAGGYLFLEHEQATAPKVGYSESQSEVDYLQSLITVYSEYAKQQGEFDKNGVFFGYDDGYFYIQVTEQGADGYGRTRISFDSNGSPAYLTYDGAAESELQINDAGDSDHYTASTRTVRYDFKKQRFYTDSNLSSKDPTVTETAIMQSQLTRLLRDFASRVKSLLNRV